MAYRICPGETVETAVRRIASEQIDKALGELSDSTLDRHEAIHQARKRCKKLRGLVRLVRPAFGTRYATENAWYRDVARTLSSIRDAESMIGAFDSLVARCKEGAIAERAGPVREVLVARRQRLADEQIDLDERLQAFAASLKAGRERIESWSLDAAGFAAVAGGLELTYARGRDALGAARSDPTPENLHEWRKRVKYGWYQHRLLRDVWKPVMNVRRRLFSDLADLLGDDHDLVVLRQTLTGDPAQFGGEELVESLVGPIERRRKQLQKQARRLGERLFAEKPKAFRKRIGRYWQASKLSQ